MIEVRETLPPLNKAAWQTVRFDQMARCVTDRVDNPSAAGVDRYVGLEHLDPECLSIRRWGSPADVESTKLRFLPGDVVFGKRRAYQRKLAVADFEGICSAHAMVLRAREDIVLPDYLPVFMQSDLFFNRALEISVGGLSPTINWKDLARQEFLLPPMEEQQRVSDLLWATEVAERRLNDTERSLLALRHALFGELDIEIERAVSCGAWSSGLLESYADVAYGLTLSAKRRSLPLTAPYLRVANVHRGRLDLSEIKTTGISISEIPRFQLNPGDVLVVEGHADRTEIGRAAIWSAHIGDVPMLHQNHILRVRCGTCLLPEFLMAQINSQRGQNYFQRIAKSTSGLNTINSRVLKSFPVGVPRLEDQERFCKRLAEVSVAVAATSAHTASLRHLRGVMCKSLLGP